MKSILITLIVFIVAVAAVAYGISYYIIDKAVSQRVEIMTASPDTYRLKAETISLISSDSISLQAWWVPVDIGVPKGVVILLHGMDGMDASSMLGHSKFLHDSGYASIALDMRAHGRSGANRVGLAITEPRDAEAALDWVERQPQLKGVPVAILGISLGGATAIRTAAKRSDVAAVISEGSFASFITESKETLTRVSVPKAVIDFLVPFIELAVYTIYRQWPQDASPIYDIARIPPRPILIAHGANDGQISVENALLLANSIKGKCELWIEQGGGHLLFKGDGTGPEDADYRAKILGFLVKSLNR